MRQIPSLAASERHTAVLDSCGLAANSSHAVPYSLSGVSSWGTNEFTALPPGRSQARPKALRLLRALLLHKRDRSQHRGCRFSRRRESPKQTQRQQRRRAPATSILDPHRCNAA